MALSLAAAALLVRRSLLLEAASSTWQPFLTLAGVLAGGLVIDSLGAFRRLAGILVPAAAPDWMAAAGTLVLTALVSGLVNLDVAVVVAVPPAIAVARERQWRGGQIAVAVALTANSTSFLLPTSNVTTLLVLDHAPISPWRYAERSWVAWLLVTALTVAVLSTHLAHGHRGRSRVRTPSDARAGMERDASFSSRALALLDLLPMFAAAAAIRALLVGGLRPGGGLLPDLLQTNLLAAGVNNLPAAAAMAPAGSVGRWAAVLGLAIGPNLVLTGSIASLIARRLAMHAGTRFPVMEFSALGGAMLPLQLLLALLGLAVSGAAGLRL